MNDSMPSNCLIRNVFVADPDSEHALFPRPSNIFVRNGRIAAIGPDVWASDVEIIDGRGAIACAGMVDSHRHIWQTAIRGVAADWSLADYVREIRVGYAAPYSPDHVYLSNYVGALEALDTGVTAVCDFSHIMNSPAHTEAAIQGLTDAGIRGVFCYGFYDVPTRSRAFANHSDRVRHADEVARIFRSTAGPLLDFGLALTEFALVDGEQTDDEIAIARRHDALITLHVGGYSYPRGIGYLKERGKLGPDMLHVHANWSTIEELELLVQAGGSLSVTPETEMQMGMGLPMTNKLLEVGGMPSFGVDIVSNNSGDMLTQLRLGLQMARAIDNQKTIETGKAPDKITMTVRDALRFGTEGGARAIRKQGEIGRLTKGLLADIVLFSAQGLHMAPMTDPVGMLLLQSRPGDVELVMVEGRIVKRDGRLVNVDYAGLTAKLSDAFREIAEHVEGARDKSTLSAKRWLNTLQRTTGGQGAA
ncbi:MAG: amidohydrolase family protein [Mesorhizobium sp.]|nr:amidohydrolase family protein [Mesorhizobium sp.]MCO5162241.1 amidohydrolase family protein [Mesorhizobium sp.]